MNAYHSRFDDALKPGATMRCHRDILGAAVLMTLIAVMICSAALAAIGEKNITPITFTETRDMRFCEFLVIYQSGVEVYNTTGLNECPAELWDALDLEKLADELGALKVQLNGPHYWMMDSNSGSFGETVSFGGIEARWGATLDPAMLQKSAQGSEPYTIFEPKKVQKQIFAKDSPVFELVDPDGNIYVLQAHKEEFPIVSLSNLGERMKKLPKGWLYRTRTLTKDLVLDLGPDKTIYAVGDEFNQYYTRIPVGRKNTIGAMVSPEMRQSFCALLQPSATEIYGHQAFGRASVIPSASRKYFP